MIDLPKPALIGVVHLPPLPGSPNSSLSIDDVVKHAVRDAVTLEDAGFDALIVENFGDAPFVAKSLPPGCVPALAVVPDRIPMAPGKTNAGITIRSDDRIFNDISG